MELGLCSGSFSEAHNHDPGLLARAEHGCFSEARDPNIKMQALYLEVTPHDLLNLILIKLNSTDFHNILRISHKLKVTFDKYNNYRNILRLLNNEYHDYILSRNVSKKINWKEYFDLLSDPDESKKVIYNDSTINTIGLYKIRSDFPEIYSLIVDINLDHSYLNVNYSWLNVWEGIHNKYMYHKDFKVVFQMMSMDPYDRFGSVLGPYLSVFMTHSPILNVYNLNHGVILNIFVTNYDIYERVVPLIDTKTLETFILTGMEYMAISDISLSFVMGSTIPLENMLDDLIIKLNKRLKDRKTERLKD